MLTQEQAEKLVTIDKAKGSTWNVRIGRLCVGMRIGKRLAEKYRGEIMQELTGRRIVDPLEIAHHE